MVVTSDAVMEGTPEAEPCCITMKTVVLPNGDVKNDLVLNTESSVQEEKEIILEDAGILNPDLYVMVLYGPDGFHVALDESKRLDEITDILAQGAGWELHIQTRGSQVDHPEDGKNLTQQLNIQIK